VATAFVPVELPPAEDEPAAIRIELRRGTTAISVSWPCAAASQCAAWMRELLR
jgi:transposase